MTIRLPVLLWEGAEAGWFGLVVGDDEAAICQASQRRALLAELVDFVRKARELNPWRIDEDCEEAELRWVKLELRAQYEDGSRRLPAASPIRVQLPCLRLVDESGLRSCVVPHLGLRFQLDSDAALPELVRHYAAEALRGLSPQQLILRLPPATCELDWIEPGNRSRGRGGALDPLRDPRLKLLLEIAEPLLKDRRLGGGATGRETESALLQERLKSTAAPLLLVGPPQVGKSTLLADVVRRLARERSPGGDGETQLRDWRWWRLSGARLIAGMRYLGQWEARCEQLIAELNQIGGVLVAENLLELISVGGSDAGDSVGAFLVPYLQRGELRLVAEATPTEVEACRRLLPSLLDCFERFPVAPFEGTQAERLMLSLSQAARSGGGVRMATEIPLKLLGLYRRFQPQAHVPGPAVRSLRKLIKQGRRQPVELDDAIAAFALETGLPEVLLRDDQPLEFSAVEARLGTQVLGQPAAIAAAAQCVISLKAGLNDPARPLGVLLFTGPSGTGKTALAKALADYCFGGGEDPQRLVRLDMSEYANYDAAARLLLSDARTPARWLQRIRAQPFCVVLLDEIEKAASEVFDLLLGLLDEGRLTDPFGRTSDFRSAIIILTSNLGASSGPRPGFVSSAVPDSSHAVSRFFRPEFYNRLDAVISFQPLGPETLRALLDKELADLAEREGLAAHGLSLDIAPELIADLLARGYNPRHGARPLQRAIETAIVSPLARWRIANPSARDQVIRIGVGTAGRFTSEASKRLD